MTIKQTTTENKKELYLMTHTIQSGKMSDLDGQTVEPKEWALYEDVDKTSGEVKEVLTVLMPDGNVYGTISRTFIESFVDLTSELGERAPFIVCSGTTKAGRTFIYPIPA